MRGSRSANTASATGAPGIMTALMRSLHQWRKCRSPVNTIARPSSSARLDDLLVAHRAAGLDDHRDAGGGGRLDAVGERVERVARARAARGPARRPSSPRSRPTRPGSAGRRRCRRPGRPSPARSRSTSRARRCATRARRRATRSSVGARLVTTRQSSRAGGEVVRRPARGTRRRSGGSRALGGSGARRLEQAGVLALARSAPRSRPRS